MGRVAEARARAIYEAHGRNANAIARMKLDPSYAIATAAGIQLPGHGMVNTYNTQTGGLVGNPGAGQRPAGSGGANPAADRALRNSISYRDAGAAMRGAGEAKPVSYTEFAGPAAANETSKGQRMDTVRDTRNLPGGMRAPAQGPEQQPMGSKPPAPMTDPTSATPPQTPSQGQPQEQRPQQLKAPKGQGLPRTDHSQAETRTWAQLVGQLAMRIGAFQKYP